MSKRDKSAYGFQLPALVALSNCKESAQSLANPWSWKLVAGSWKPVA